VALALYRKYRPRTFAEVIGQEHVTEPLSQALRSGRLHHAYLFSGPRGCGKTSSARILARSLNCAQGPTPEPCGVCLSCRSLANDGGGSIDVIEIDAASHGGVDDARDLREKAFFAPASSRYKIYVIDEAHMVSSAGFNALLKLVEEPPDYVKFIFATTEPEKVLGTIRSRTHHYPFRLIPPAVLRPYLQQLTEAEGVHVEPAVLPLVVKAGGGSARDTLSVLDQLIAGAGPEGVSYTRAVALLAVTDVALIDEMCDALAAGDGAAAYATIDRVAEAGHDPRRFASDLLERLRDLIILQQVPDAVTKGLIDGPTDQLEAMSAQATRLGPATLSRCADIVHNGLVEMRGTTAPRLLLELITARMLLPGAEDATGALLQRLERMERRLTLTADQNQTDLVRPEPAQTAAEATGANSAGGLSAARAAAAAAGRRAPSAPHGAEASPPPPATGNGALPLAQQRPSDRRTRPESGAAATPHRPATVESGDQPAADRAGADRGGVDRAGAVSAGADPAGAGRGPSGPDDAVDEWVGGEDEEYPFSEFDDLGPAGDAFGAASPARPSAAAALGRVPDRAVRRPEPAGLMPDAPEEPMVAAAPTGQLSAASIRDVWPEIMTAVGRKSKKIAALAQGATVRELEGQTVVLIFRFPAHAKMVAAEPALISDALYEALGGRWQIRCDVAGEAGPSQGSPDRGNPARNAPPASRPAQQDGGPAPRGNPAPAQSRSDQSVPAVRREPASQAPPAAGGEPVGQGSSAAGRESARQGLPAAGHEPARLGSSAVGREPACQTPPAGGSEAAHQAPSAGDGDDWPEPARLGGTGAAAEEAPAEELDWPEHAIPGGGAPVSAPHSEAGSAPSAHMAGGSGAGSAPATQAESGSGGSTAPNEPPHDAYDGPATGGTASYEGFDPGDEPLDDVIDEKTARQSSEQQAMQLLQAAFGAEKISEM
jgi:DNA polymerase-3 subunit gamma/tau